MRKHKAHTAAETVFYRAALAYVSNMCPVRYLTYRAARKAAAAAGVSVARMYELDGQADNYFMKFGPPMWLNAK